VDANAEEVAVENLMKIVMTRQRVLLVWKVVVVDAIHVNPAAALEGTLADTAGELLLIDSNI
jgi:hypothetical protein